ncbi:hypothetical protein [Thermocrispum agreste]|uniref:hypothetical protein n=1 Tax=Thermocrispum agreste TaxID=37925 RepID=UPI0012EC5C08|nr:hypothetical protein [Thermocrispum agreste]
MSGQARRSAESSGGLTRVLVRACAVLGGTIAGTAVAWALASGTASAEDDRVVEPSMPVTDAVHVVEHGGDRLTEAADRVAPRLSGADQVVTEVAAPHQVGVPAVQPAEAMAIESLVPDRFPLPDTVQWSADHSRDVSELGADRAGTHRADSDRAEVADPTRQADDTATSGTKLQSAPGTDVPEDRTGEQAVHHPESVPAVPSSPVTSCPAAATCGGSAGHLSMLAFVGTIPAATTYHGDHVLVVTNTPHGRTVSTGDQPGTSPD